ncbi:hypothetical protein GUJ93_ZPchr0009g2385 [Zizania palustris]|uniref:Uncharacterized protein n=1 Tax=Zizania palustris TaxID=103762 RepID=A0A8J5RYP0_ZIZPA|nr:hypothetical protein GUJ93_ZPchr0009g2385 [Zizania palustris]
MRGRWRSKSGDSSGTPAPAMRQWRSVAPRPWPGEGGGAPDPAAAALQNRRQQQRRRPWPCGAAVEFRTPGMRRRLWRGETIPEIIARLKRDIIPTIKSGLIYWPLCDFITFKFIPVHLQPLVSNSFSFLWTIYITYMASLKKADVDVDEFIVRAE